MTTKNTSASAVNGGTMTAVSTNCKKTGTAPTNIEHNTPISTSSYAQYKWVAPATGTVVTLYAAINGVNNNGNTSGDKVVNYVYTLSPASTTGIEDYKNTEAFQLNVFPNPASEEVNLSYNLNEKATVSARLYNINGELITELFSQEQSIGKQTVLADLPAGLSKGIYFVRLIVNQQICTQKLVVY